MTRETQLTNQYTTTTIDNNIDEMVTQVLNSFDHAQPWDNKVDTNIKGHYTHQDMLEATNSNVPNPPHHNTIGSAFGSSVTPSNKGWPRRKSRY
jgi:hypothetical protein